MTQPEEAGEIVGELTACAVGNFLDYDRKRNVLVVHGRDEQVRRAMFEFLRALDLRPLQWESLVKETRSAAPSLREAVHQGLRVSQAAIVLMTPEDVVRLHPDLHKPREGQDEVTDSMQARPNVLLELGMALALKPEQTLVVILGEQRPMADLAGLNFIQIRPDSDWRGKIAARLSQAGCAVDWSSQDWRYAGDFDNLAALNRTPGTGSGRAVVTVSDDIQSAYDDRRQTGIREPASAIFVSALVEGLESGGADLNRDGRVELAELYEYIYEKVRVHSPDETPEKWLWGVQVELLIARLARSVTTAAPLAPELQALIESTFAAARAVAVEELKQVLRGGHRDLVVAAQLALGQLADDDSKTVSAAATAALRDFQQPSLTGDASIVMLSSHGDDLNPPCAPTA